MDLVLPISQSLKTNCRPRAELNTMSSFSASDSKESLWRLAVDGSPSGLVIADENDQIVLVNQSARRMFGYETEEFIGQSMKALLAPSSGIHQRHIPEQSWMGRIERPITVERNSIAKRKDGTEFPVSFSLHPIETERGKLVLANVIDVTERQKIELAQCNQAASDRLMLVGQLSGGVAHEIRTPLSVIRNDVYFLQSLGNRLGLEASEALQEISEALAKAIRIVGELLDFTRPPISRPESVRFSSILAAALKSYRLPSRVKLQTGQSIEDCIVQADSEQVERILINLLRNATQAMRGTGTIEIECGGDHQIAWFEVIDDGPGISESDRYRVFDPLFTTKATGIGLGLAISLRYARSNYGDLTVCNRAKGGACFKLSLPRGILSTELANHE